MSACNQAFNSFDILVYSRINYPEHSKCKRIFYLLVVYLGIFIRPGSSASLISCRCLPVAENPLYNFLGRRSVSPFILSQELAPVSFICTRGMVSPEALGLSDHIASFRFSMSANNLRDEGSFGTKHCVAFLPPILIF